MSDPLRKCISMGGPAPLRAEGHPNDLRLWGNREYVAGQSGTSWVKLWVSWADLQGATQPRSREESWFELNMAPRGQAWLWRLDKQVRAANDDGVGVILALYHAFPAWASTARGGDPDTGRGPDQRVPDDLSPDGPWGWFVSYLCARYRGGVNPIGPREPFPGEGEPGGDPRGGNPDGARVDALEVCNEPNVLLWPQRGMPERVAEMIRTAAAVSAAQRGPRILGPSTLDSPDPGDPPRPAARTDWRTFSLGVLRALRDFRPEVPVSWSHHNYRDIKREVSGERSRVRQVVGLLREEDWLGGGDPRVWLTEGGLNLYPDQDDPTALRAQARAIRRNFLEMRDEPDVFLWTQHSIHDITGNQFKSGLRDDFRATPEAPGPGAPRPAFEVWSALPGAPV